MIRYALAFLAVAIIAAVLGFRGIVGTGAWFAQVCLIFLVFAILASLRKSG